MGIVILYMLFYSFHILQFLDVKCFNPSKVVYEKENKIMIWIHLTHIIKNNVFLFSNKPFSFQ